MALFPSEPVRFDCRDADISYYPGFYNPTEADRIFKTLYDNAAWQQDDIRVFGKVYAQPRLTALYGDGSTYSYSGITMQPHPWNAVLAEIKSDLRKVCSVDFTTALLNLYRDGKDSNGWHADDEKELGTHPVIASLSFGAERIFKLRHNSDPHSKRSMLLEHGSLLLMQGATQHFWKHQIPKTAKPVGPRINLTFRVIQ